MTVAWDILLLRTLWLTDSALRYLFVHQYHAQRAVVKLAVSVAKSVANWHLGQQLGNGYVGNKWYFEKREHVRKGVQAKDKLVKDVNGQTLLEGEEDVGRVFWTGAECGWCKRNKH